MKNKEEKRPRRRIVGATAVACVVAMTASSAFAQTTPTEDPHSARPLAAQPENPAFWPAAAGAVVVLGAAVYLLGEVAYDNGYENGQQTAQVEDLQSQVQGTITNPPRGGSGSDGAAILLD